MNTFTLPTVALPTVALLAAGLLGGLAGCAPAAPPPAHHASSPAAPAAGDVNDADVAFTQGMIPHHQQAIELSDLLLAKDSVDPELVTLARAIKAAQQPEIDTMTSWLADWGRPATPSGHQGHGESDGGMATAADLERIRASDTAAAERLFLTLMIAHHEGAVGMGETELKQGRNPAARELAQTIIDTQQAEITTMKELLQTR
ncbi:DUF305 domain-containing protein [Microlunatus speluncae]|uniref:DUF305 domain-containing protein n=1 Tax=Microlunatus speluncae TaxID=2594267 RepID=UPI0012668619|nr:DUF305 domain-containing protein [Microlunatus speluncae]